MNQPDVECDWQARGFSCDTWIDAPGQRWDNFIHSADELVMVIEGQMEVEIEGETFRPRPNEELLIPAGARHSVRNIGSTVARWLYGYKH